MLSADWRLLSRGGQLEFTRKCVAALMRQTGPNWELIVINNGSILEQETTWPAFKTHRLRLSPLSPMPRIVGSRRRSTKASNTPAVNNLVLLNNDVVVTDGWLGQLIGLASIDVEEKHEIRNSKSEMGDSKSVIGWVGPMSNYAAPPQLVEDVPSRYGNDESFCGAVARRASGELVHRSQAFGVLSAHETSRL
jgi:O-antigen biosynthesis protein